MIPAILGGLQGAFQLGTGIANLFKAKSIKPQRPSYDFEALNKGQLENKSMFTNAMNAGMPGLQNINKQTDANMANATTAIQNNSSSGSNNILALTGALAQADQAKRDTGMQNAQYQTNMMGQLAQTNSGLDQGRLNAFQFNQVEPYMLDMQRKQQLTTSGLSAINSGLSSAMNVAGQMNASKNTLTRADLLKIHGV
jgi:hypothetical protein